MLNNTQNFTLGRGNMPQNKQYSFPDHIFFILMFKQNVYIKCFFSYKVKQLNSLYIGVYYMSSLTLLGLINIFFNCYFS